MIGLSDRQLSIVMEAAKPLPPDVRKSRHRCTQIYVR